MKHETESTAIFLLLHDTPGDPPVMAMVNCIRNISGWGLRDAAWLLYRVLTEDLDYRTDPKVASALRRLSSLPSLKLSLPADCPAEQSEIDQATEQESLRPSP